MDIGHLVDGLRRYVQDGVAPGGFLYHFIINDLAGALDAADPDVLHGLPMLRNLFRDQLPVGCFGSYEIYKRWTQDDDYRRSVLRGWRDWHHSLPLERL